MWLLLGNQLLYPVLMLITMSQAFLIIGPNIIRANQEYTLVISNFHRSMNTIKLLLRLEEYDDDGQTLLKLNQTIDVKPNTNRIVSFKIPAIESPGQFNLAIDGMAGFNFNDEIALEYKFKSMAGLIQLSKPVFKPGDEVQFRVIVLDPDLKPHPLLKMVSVTVQDSYGNNIRKWTNAQLYNGVLDATMGIALAPLLGTYNIIVEANNEELVSKPFEVKEYVMSTFDVDIFPTVTPIEMNQALNITITAYYYFGKPVIGKAIILLYDEDDNLEFLKEYDVNGMLQVYLPFTNELILYGEQQDIRLNVTFTEQFTNRNVTKERYITVYKHKYQIRLEKENPTFRPGLPFNCLLKVEERDGTPAKRVTVEVLIHGQWLSNQEQSYMTDDTGAIKLQLNPSASAETIQIIVSSLITQSDDKLSLVDSFYEYTFFQATIDDQEFEETIIKVERNVDKFIKIDLKDRYVDLNDDMKLKITCSDQMTFFVYYIVSKGNIVDSGFARPNKESRYTQTLKATEKMMPRAKVIVATTSNNVVLFDYVDIEFNEFQNKINITLNEVQFGPGEPIELQVNGLPNAYVALASYAANLHQHGNDHDIMREDIWKILDYFHSIPQNDHDKFHSMGLFVRTLYDVTIDAANDWSARTGENRGGTEKTSSHLLPKLIPYRTDFHESWLWNNITLPRSGRAVMVEHVPDEIASWYITGFSIDSVHGLGFVKKPIQFRTVKPFYIVDNLPYSIKRFETIELHFTLFSDLGVTNTANVTMYIRHHEFEFVGYPADVLVLTKSVTVSSEIANPISFLVKPRKLGFITVRLVASIMLGLETDAIEKNILVTPESMVLSKMQIRLFSSPNPVSLRYPINLNINKQRIFESYNIDISLNPSILTHVFNNVKNLLTVPSGCGEQNIIFFVTNIAVLDYLTATEPKQTNVIMKWKKYLGRGYTNQMKYRQRDGSYGIWRASGSSVFLTAFVAISLLTASNYIYVEEFSVSKAYDWLATKQQLDGHYYEVGLVSHQNIKGGVQSRLSLTCFVMIAFMENPQHVKKYRSTVKRGIMYIAAHLEDTIDSYEIAIATYALWMNNHKKKNLALDKLIGLSEEVENGTQRYWPNNANQIETTAYALLSFVEAGRKMDGILILRWLLNQRYTTGTQETFIALRALSKLMLQINPFRNDYAVEIRYGGYRKVLRFNSTTTDKFEFKIPNANEVLFSREKLDVLIEGQGNGVIKVIETYSINLVNFEPRFKIGVSKTDPLSETVLNLLICASFIPQFEQRSNMALVEVTLPNGYITETGLIVEKPGINPIRKKEILYGATTAVLYYDNMGAEDSCFTISANRRFQRLFRSPVYVKVQDYYHPEITTMKIYDADNQEVCDDCDTEDCSQSCYLS